MESIVIVLVLMSVILNITFHEFMHGWTAHKLGDPTPARQKRLTLNPIAHFDIMGALCLLMTNGSFGWGKPVEVNPLAFRNIRRGELLVSAAGPATNVAIFVVSAMLFHLVTYLGSLPWIEGYHNAIEVARLFLFLNCIIGLSLATFNLLPIFPLDGSHILAALSPRNWQPAIDKLNMYGPLILIFLILTESFLKIPLLITLVQRIIIPNALALFKVSIQ